MRRIIFFTTCDATADRKGDLERMLEGVATSRWENPQIDIRVELLFQRCPAGRTLPDLPDWVTPRAIDSLIPLSSARNLLLRAAVDAGPVCDDDIYAFPDDDSWYPSGLIGRVVAWFENDDQLDFWFCRYGAGAARPAEPQTVRPNLQQVISLASSNTMFFRGGMLMKIGFFDEDIGIGTPTNGGEDTEYGIRAYYSARHTMFADAKLVGHRDPDPSLVARYYPGSLRAITTHRSKSAEGRLAYFRKLAVGLFWVARGALAPSDYFASIVNSSQRRRTFDNVD